MHALVTGGAGFIGSRLVERLVAEGHRVDVVDDLSTGSLSRLAGARQLAGHRLSFQNLDICTSELEDFMASRRPEVVFHLAAQIDVRRSVADPILDAQVNILGTLRVLQGAVRAGSQRVVFAASGGTLYGAVARENLPIAESAPFRPVSPYGVAKRAGLDYLRTFRELHDLEFCALALANVYGPGQDTRGEAGVVAIFANQILNDEPCTIFGSGEQTRDFVFVDDVVDALVRAVERGGGLVINIGTGTSLSVSKLWETMCRLGGSTRPAIMAPARLGELEHNSLDCRRAAVHLGWRPWTSLEEGIRATLDWAAQAQRKRSSP